jgi:hypothetical protein
MELKIAGKTYAHGSFYRNENVLLGKLPRGTEFGADEEGTGWIVTFRGLTTAQVERLAELTKDGL